MAEKQDPIQEMVAAARRTQILDAATVVFAKKGFHRATVKDIAQQAGVADGTIYTYFESKTDVLLHILQRLNQSTEREQDFARGTEQDFRTFFVTYVRQRMTLLWPNAEVFRAVLPEMLVNPELRDLYNEQVLVPTFAIGEKYFQQAIQRGIFRPIDVPLMMRTLAGTFIGLLIIQLLGDKEIEKRWEEIPEVFATMVLDGVAAKPE